MHTKLYRLMVCLGLALGLVSSLRAYVYLSNEITWLPGQIPMQIMVGTGHTSENTDFAHSAQDAMTTWNGYLGTVQFQPQIVAAGTGTTGNGINEVYFASTMEGQAFGTGVLAVTLTLPYPSINQFYEADIIFNTAYTWDSYSGNLRTPEDFHRVALHELGHVLGLDHPDENGQTLDALMNAYIGNLDHLTADDIAGAQSLYRAPGQTSPSSNDNFANAIGISLGNGSTQVSGDSTYATVEPGEPNHDPGAGEGGASVWWKWTAPNNGSMTVTTQYSHFDTLLGVYTGSAVNSLTTIAVNDDVDPGVIQYSTITFTATAGTAYYFAVAGWKDTTPGAVAASGLVKLNLSFTSTDIAPSLSGPSPSTNTINLGGMAQFIVGVSGAPSPSLQWQRNAGGAGTWANLSDGANYSGTNASTLTIRTADAAMDGDQFRCFASNINGNTYSSVATLYIVSPPIIITQPADQTVIEGNFALFSVAAAGTAPFSYRWQASAPGSGTWSDLSDDSNYSGTDTDNLNIVTTMILDGYSYRCNVSNNLGSVISSAAPLAVTPAVPPSYSLSQTQLDLCVVAGINQLPIRLPISLNAGVDISTLSVSSNASWVSPAIDQGSSCLVLTFSTQNLVSASNAAAVVITRAGESPLVLHMNAVVSVANIVMLVDDPTRSVTYGLHQNGLGQGAVVCFDPINGTYLGSISVGEKPGDIAIRADGREMLVICSASKTISVIDLVQDRVVESIALNEYTDWGPSDTSAHVQYGPNNIIYYTDGNWSPVLRVFNRSTHTVVQTVTDVNGFGFGDFSITPDQTQMFAWGQYGWTAGSASSTVAKFNIAGDGTITANQANTSLGYPTFSRDPLNTPALITTDGMAVFIKQYAFSTSSVITPTQTFSSPVYAISPLGEIAATANGIFETATGNKLYDLTPNRTVQTITSDYARLVYFDATSHQLGTINLFDAIGPTVLGRNLAPTNGAVVLAPTSLNWAPLPGIDQYQVYLGTSAAAVGAATTDSPEYLGKSIGSTFALVTPPAPGVTYYWRVDAVNSTGVTLGQVYSFTVATIASSQSKINVSTVSGDKSLTCDITLTSAVAGQTWAASADVPWISFASSTGTTPAMLRVQFDASTLPTGLNQGTVTITANDGSFSLPVTLRVDPLAITVLRTRPGSTKVYAISEENASAYNGMSRAYLLEIDTLFKRIDRVVPVGTGVTDLAVHEADGRVYVTNWKFGSLLAINLSTFALERTYAVPPFGASGSHSNDVYRVSAGRPGQLIVEAEDQWINVSIFDTNSGQILSSAWEREGGGACDPTGRYYYHGDNDISNASLHKFDIVGDQWNELASSRVAYVSYYGSRTVVVSEDGQRIFWNGVVFNPDLNSVWVTGEAINSVSSDGRYAFSGNKIYDVDRQTVVATLPATASVSAFNSIADELVFQQGDALGFYQLPNAVIPVRTRMPANNAIVGSVSELQWSPIPGATGYRVYLGTSESAVATAIPGSPEDRGDVTDSKFSLISPLAAGQHYYWRVDIIVGNEVAPGGVQSFVVSPVAPDVTSIDARTVKGDRNYRVPITLSASANGTPWTADTSAPWIHLDHTSGTAPDTLSVSLDTGSLPTGQNQGSITLSGNGYPITIPVSLWIDPLSVTIIKSDPHSANVYAVSEDGTDTSSRAYLLEIDTAAEKISRVTPAGTGVTDLAIHDAESRIYVTNWKLGGLLAFDKNTLNYEHTYPFEAGGGGYTDKDVYRVSAGTAGRLVVEAEDQWIDISLFDTNSGQILASSSEREGGGACDPTGRYYYHGDNNDSGAEIHKLDLAGDHLLELAHVRVSSYSSYGSRTVVMSDDGSRVFWSGSAFDKDLNEIWSMGAEIYSTSDDGRFGFGQTSIYDTVEKKVVSAMPVITKISAFNGTTDKLIVQQGPSFAFLKMGPTGTVGIPSVMIQPQDRTTQAGGTMSFTVQASSPVTMSYQWQTLPAGSDNWENVTDNANFNGSLTASVTVTGTVLAQNGTQFRCVLSNTYGSTISTAATLTVTAPGPIIISQPTNQFAPAGSPAVLSVTVTSDTTSSYQWQHDGEDIPGADQSTYSLASVQPSDEGSYRVVVTNSAGSTTSDPATVTIALPPTITTPPASQTVYAGASATFSVTASSNAPATYQWYHADTLISGATQNSYTIANTQLADAGDYTVVVTNVAGSATSAAATLTVNPSVIPVIIQQPLDQPALVGGSATFAIAATGTPAPAYQWQVLRFGGDIWYNIGDGGGSYSGSTTSSLTISDLLAGESGDQYRCVVGNVAGSVTSNAATLTVGVSGFAKVSAGRYHSLRLSTTGQLYATGTNTYGQLGTGTTTNATSPQLVTIAGQTVTDIAAGGQHSLFLTASHELWAVGFNGNDQLGDGTTTSRSTPYKLASDVVAMAAGYFHSAFIKTDGSLWICGGNDSGQLGNGTTTDAATPIQIATDVIDVALGIRQTFYLKADGTLWGTGDMYNNGTTVATPMQIATHVTAVAAGGYHSLFLKDDGSLWALGYNLYGQLGDGTTTTRTTPVQVATGVQSIATGYFHSAFIKTDHTLWVMGRNDSGSLGDVSAANRLAPFPLDTNVAVVSASESYTLYTKLDGSLHGIGYNAYGQFGNGTTTVTSTPVSIAAGVVLAPDAPAGLTATAAAPFDRVFLTWTAQSAAAGFEVWRSTTNDAAAATRIATPRWPFFEDTSVTSGQTYFYWLKALNASGESAFSAAAAVVTGNALSQSITFTGPADQGYSATPITLAATASSGLPVTFSLVSGPATLSGDQLTLTGPGTVIIRASQAGNGSYAAATDVDRTFTVSAAIASVTLGDLQATYDGNPHAVSATTDPIGLIVTFTYDGNATVPVAAGSYAVTGTIDDPNYQGSATDTLVIDQAIQTITFAPLSDVAYGADPINLSASATSGLSVTFSVLSGHASLSGNSLSLTGAGAVTVRAAQAGDANHLAAAHVDHSFTVSGNLASWQAGYFTTAELTDPSLSGPSADPDHDGLTNLLEYALGLNPRQTDTTGLPEMSTTATDWVYTFTRPTDRPDLTYSVEVSTDLVTWSSNGVILTMTGDSGGAQTWQASVPTGLTDKLFFRLKITQN